MIEGNRASINAERIMEARRLDNTPNVKVSDQFIEQSMNERNELISVLKEISNSLKNIDHKLDKMNKSIDNVARSIR